MTWIDFVVLAISSGLSSVLACAGLPLARRLIGTDSRWLRPAVLAPVAALAGAWAWWASQGGAVLSALVAFAAGGSLLAVVDAASKRLPDLLVLPTTVMTGVTLVFAASSSGAWTSLLHAIGCALVFGLVYFVMAWCSPKSLGLGDVKLAPLVGLVTGWFGLQAAAAGFAAAFVLMAVVGLFAMALRRTKLAGELPFGPWMLLGAAVAVALHR